MPILLATTLLCGGRAAIAQDATPELVIEEPVAEVVLETPAEVAPVEETVASEPTEIPVAADPVMTPAASEEFATVTSEATVIATEVATPTVVTEAPDLNSVSLTIACDTANPATIARGQQSTVACALVIDAAAELDGLLALDARIGVASMPEGAAASLGGQPCADGGEDACFSATALSAHTELPFTTIIDPGCASGVASGTHALTLSGQATLASLDANRPSATLARDLSQTAIAFTVTSDAPVVASGATPQLGFGGSTWTGTAYTPMTATLPIEIAMPASGCVDASYTVSITGDAPLSNGSTTIPNDDIQITSVVTTSAVTWGAPVETAGTLGSPQPVFVTQPSNSPDDRATVVVGLSLVPPEDASPGAYTGTITITISPSP